jgi:hypothetical protein
VLVAELDDGQPRMAGTELGQPSPGVELAAAAKVEPGATEEQQGAAAPGETPVSGPRAPHNPAVVAAGGTAGAAASAPQEGSRDEPQEAPTPAALPPMAGEAPWEAAALLTWARKARRRPQRKTGPRGRTTGDCPQR